MWARGGILKEKRRPGLSPASARIVVDSVFDDGTARILWAGRRKSGPNDQAKPSGWKKEDDGPHVR